MDSTAAQPTVDGVNSWAISKAVREAGITVALSGLGGDELFQGYSTFRRVPQLARVGATVPRALLGWADRATAHSSRLSLSRTARAGESVHRGGLPAAYAGMRGLFSWRALNDVWPGGHHLTELFRDEDLLVTQHEGAETVAALELHNYLPHQLLRDTDAMSMAHSIEVRVPLLDDAVLEASLATRPSTQGLRGKSLLAAAAGPVTAAAAQRPKLTFTLPFDQWLRADLRPWTRRSLDRLAGSGLGFDARAVRAVDEAFLAGNMGWRPLWGLAVLGAWLEQHDT